MKNRYIPAILCAAIALCALTACGDTQSSKADTSQTTTTTTAAQTTVTTSPNFAASIQSQPPQPEPAQASSGDLTDSIKWELTVHGALILTGSGDMPALAGGGAPWYPMRKQITSITLSDKITSIGSGAFSGCICITQMSIPESVTAIGESAFYGCESLKEITIPDSVTKLGDCVFWRCFGLEKAVVGKGVKELPFDTFCRCRSLKDVTLCEGLERIGNTVFEYCESLTELTLPSTVKDFGYCIFPDDSSRLTLKGKAGSPAQDYANKHSIRFEAV